MREIPILFCRQMSKAAREGRKTMTRRLVKPQPDESCIGMVSHGIEFLQVFKDGEKACVRGDMKHRRTCPFGERGDLLWVKETHYALGRWVLDGETKGGRSKWRFSRAVGVQVEFDPPDGSRKSRDKQNPGRSYWYKRSALFMRKEDARTWLERTETRVERVQEISEEDARAEGVSVGCPTSRDECGMDFCEPGIDVTCPDLAYKGGFKEIWERLHGKGAWKENKWVWVVGFKLANEGTEGTKGTKGGEGLRYLEFRL